MIQISSNSNDPTFNLAMEEYYLKQDIITDDILFLWQNTPAVVIGKNQNAYAEVNFDYLTSHQISVVRRMSGGGAVYHDLGNLNFTMIKQKPNLTDNTFKQFTLPIIHSLEKLGIHAVFSGRNDIEIGGKKISGNAQYYYKDKVLHHGTLLFDSDLSAVEKVLNVSASKIASKGIRSVKSRVTNIAEHLPMPMSIAVFKQHLLLSVAEEMGAPLTLHLLSAQELTEIKRLQKHKYKSFQWNYGTSPAADYVNEIWTSSGNIMLHMKIEHGMIQSINIYGDFFEIKPIEDLISLLEGKPFCLGNPENILNGIDVSDYIRGLENSDFIRLFI